MRATSVIWLGVILVTGVAVFSVKGEVASLEEELLRVRKGTAQDRDAIHVLNAEWSYLNQPTRLAELTKRHLPLLQPIPTAQYADRSRLDELRWKPGYEPMSNAPSAAPPPAIGASVASLPPLQILPASAGNGKPRSR
jgi:hypothetical protein